MDPCSALANTGLSLYSAVALALALIIVSATLYLKRHNIKTISFMVAALMLTSSLTPVLSATASAAPLCGTAIPDTSTGLQGHVQSYSILANDTPTPGAGWVLGALTIALPDNPY